jgi:hypothetical protein
LQKHSTIESYSEGTPTLQPKKKVFISENIGQSKSTEDETTDTNSSTNSTVKHWQRNFKPRVLHQPIASALKKSGYSSGQNPQHKKTLNKAKYYQPIEYFSDSEAGEIDYLRDYHTPTGLVDHEYIWQVKQLETAKLKEQRFTIRESGPAISDATTPQLTNHMFTTHNVQPNVLLFENQVQQYQTQQRFNLRTILLLRTTYSLK